MLAVQFGESSADLATARRHCNRLFYWYHSATIGVFCRYAKSCRTITTKGGIVLHGGTQDYYLRAYDVETGEVLWQGRLLFGAQATPMSYIDERTGRQFAITTASGACYNPND